MGVVVYLLSNNGVGAPIRIIFYYINYLTDEVVGR